MKNFIFGLSLIIIAAPIEVCKGKCYEIINGQPVLIPCPPDPEPTKTPPPEPTNPPPSNPPTPCPSATPCPCGSDGIGTSPSGCPFDICKPCPEPTPTPIPNDCSVYNPDKAGFNPLTCTFKNKQVCGTPTNIPCGCNGDNCTFNVKQDWVCSFDSTPRYNGKPVCWKTNKVERCEYPPGSKCGLPTVWSHDVGISLDPEDDFGAKVKFPNKGSFRISAETKGQPGTKTSKTAKVQ